ncbi:MAG: hypothetical protein K1X68_10730 [Saprospiraceae bacterium]|nr:hypothetical protein [Saprospiraceae bacterium]HMW40032.1 hypothetical protein [Saprospiraceae bacterium]HMX89174.1 hypothetical protein [Saprospiraceae bacterium]HMZ40765.1 hypothetical protein [Saprospiraceae bacterium]HNA64884.1 hypothetical protein [Saprospiraceae bacterium]
MKKTIFLGLFAIAITFQYACVGLEKSEIKNSSGTLTTRERPKIKARIGHNHCADPRGVCIIVQFISGDPVGDDETVAEVDVLTNQLKLYPDKVIWDQNGIVPITESIQLSNAVCSDLGISNNSYVNTGNYSINTSGAVTTVTVNYSN